MKLIDKYLLRTFAGPLVYCLLAFTILIVVHDLFDHLSDFVEANTPIRDIIRFYMLLLPSVLVLIIPVSLLLAVLYSLLQLTRNNELTAMRASGISLYRLVLPFITVSLLFTIGVAIVHETVAPFCAYWSQQFIQEQKQKRKGITGLHIVSNLPYHNEPQNRIWIIGSFNTRTYRMENLTITQERDDGTAESKIHAGEAEWLDNSWWLRDVAIQELDEYGNPKRIYDKDRKPIGSTRYERQMELTDYNEAPDHFLNEIKDPEFLSSRQLLTFIKTHRRLSEDRISQIRVDFHHRLAMPWMSFIVALIGIPFGTQTARKGTFAGVVLSIGLFFGYYFLINLGLWAGKELIIPPWVAGWSPNIVFLTLGVALIYRMR